MMKRKAEKEKQDELVKKLSALNLSNYAAPLDNKFISKSSEFYRTASCNSHFLDQTLKLSRSPYEIEKFDVGVPPPIAEEYLCCGVSKEGQGRSMYLKERKRIGPQERYGRPITSAQEVGWKVPSLTYSMSPHARKPLIQQTFFRQTGVLNYKI